MPELVDLTVDETLGSHAVVTVAGELDISTSPLLKAKLLELIADGCPAVIVDLGPTSFMDSSALAALLHSWKAASAYNTPMAVVSPFSHISRIFELTGVSRTVPLFATVDEAVAAVGSTPPVAEQSPAPAPG